MAFTFCLLLHLFVIVVEAMKKNPFHILLRKQKVKNQDFENNPEPHRHFVPFRLPCSTMTLLPEDTRQSFGKILPDVTSSALQVQHLPVDYSIKNN